MNRRMKDPIDLIDLSGVSEEDIRKYYKEDYTPKSIKKIVDALIPHGKWIDHWFEDLQKQGYRQCSKCKAGCQIYEHGTRKSDLPWIDGEQFTLQRFCKYCPNCGAKMDGKGAKT